MSSPGVLIVNAELKLSRMIADGIKEEDCVVYEAHNGHSALRMLQYHSIDVMLLNDHLLDMSGLELLAQAKEHSPRTVVFLLIEHGDSDLARQAVRLGATNCFHKPGNEKVVLQAIRDAFQLLEENRTGIIFRSEAMHQVWHMLGQVADTRMSVLLYGESGVGKSMLARWIHRNSRRRQHPFISANCSDLPESLLDQELFGRAGKFALAHLGTLFLGDVCELSPKLQGKLNNVLQDGRVYLEEEQRYIEADVRVIATSCRSLRPMVGTKQFDIHLYERLNLVEVQIPPLRERREDIQPLLHARLAELNIRYGKPLTLSRELLHMLCEMPWHGNIRELYTMIERIYLLNIESPSGTWQLPDWLTVQQKQPDKSGCYPTDTSLSSRWNTDRRYGGC